jgi:hypothetical protein
MKTIASLIIGLAAILIACHSGGQAMVQVHASPKDVAPGGTAILTAQIQNPPANRRFQWNAAHGRLNPQGVDESPTREYIAPDSPGNDVVTVRLLDGQHEVAEDSVAIAIRGTAPATISEPASATPVEASAQGAEKPKSFHFDDVAVPSGWMGDAAQGTTYVQVDPSSRENPHSGVTCYRWHYTPGPQGWAAVAWQFPENNWGGQPGRDMSGYTRVSFWARGQKGGERLQFKAGGQTTPNAAYPATFEVDSDMIVLTDKWARYSLSLAGKNLSNTACFFVWVAQARQNPDGLTFFLDDLYYER